MDLLRRPLEVIPIAVTSIHEPSDSMSGNCEFRSKKLLLFTTDALLVRLKRAWFSLLICMDLLGITIDRSAEFASELLPIWPMGDLRTLETRIFVTSLIDLIWERCLTFSITGDWLLLFLKLSVYLVILRSKFFSLTLMSLSPFSLFVYMPRRLPLWAGLLLAALGPLTAGLTSSP